MRRRWWAAGVLALALGCGGSTANDSKGTGGAAGSGGGSGGGVSGGSGGGVFGGAGGSGNVSGGGGALGGSGGACDPAGCGPTGAACCDVGTGCGFATPGGNVSCSCMGDLRWQCTTSGGAGGTGGCDPNACGPSGTPCCTPGIGCASSAGGAPGVTCSCTAAGIWKCSGGSGGAGGSGGGTSCTGPTSCPQGLSCCAGKCVNVANDPFNCGGCSNVCAANPPFCNGVCGPTPCSIATDPPPGTFCCGTNFCKQGQLCCEVNGPGPSGGPTCHTPTPQQPTCPIGCPLCQ
ncbi:MAG: hypothetical protein U0263_24750 [Polyangiaceae bacterium]